MTLIHHPRMSLFSGSGLPDCNKHQGEGEPREGGTVMSHTFQEGVGGRDESPKEGWGDRDESSKRGDKGGRGLHQSQPRGGGGGGADYVIECAKWVLYYYTPLSRQLN